MTTRPAGARELERTQRAVFLDKDGTLIEDVPYNVDPERVRLAPGAAQGITLLAAAGYRLAVVSNQSGVARGRFPAWALAKVRTRLDALFAAHEAALDGFYYCPHHPEGSVAAFAHACDCRKPRPGMLLRAAGDLRVAPEHAWMVGDILDDVEAGRAAGCRTVLIDNGHETEWQRSPAREPHHCAPDLAAAARLIIAADRQATKA